MINYLITASVDNYQTTPVEMVVIETTSSDLQGLFATLEHAPPKI